MANGDDSAGSFIHRLLKEEEAGAEWAQEAGDEEMLPYEEEPQEPEMDELPEEEEGYADYAEGEEEEMEELPAEAQPEDGQPAEEEDPELDAKFQGLLQSLQAAEAQDEAEAEAAETETEQAAVQEPSKPSRPPQIAPWHQKPIGGFTKPREPRGPPPPDVARASKRRSLDLREGPFPKWASIPGVTKQAWNVLPPPPPARPPVPASLQGAEVAPGAKVVPPRETGGEANAASASSVGPRPPKGAPPPGLREQKGDGRVVPARKKETAGPAERSANASAALEKAKDLFSKGKKNGDQPEASPPLSARCHGLLLALGRCKELRFVEQTMAPVLWRGITMSWTTPWFRDDEKPFLQRTDTMSLDIIRPKDVPRGQVMFPKDYDKSLITEDIHRCQPHYDHLNYLNKPDMSVGCTDPVHVGGKARSYYAPMDRRPRDLSLTTADIELAIPRGGNHKGSRHTDPVCPRYEMPSSYQAPVPEPRWNGRHATDNSDIEKSHPRVLHPDRNYVRDPNEGRDIEYTTPNYAEKLNALRARARPDFSLNVQDILGTKPARPRCTDPLDPSYKVPTSATTSLHAKYAEEKGLGIELPSLQVREVGYVEGSRSKRLTWDNGEPHLSLLREADEVKRKQQWLSRNCGPWHSAWFACRFILRHLPTQAIAELRSLVDKLEASGEVLSEQNNVTLNPHLRHQEIMEAVTDRDVLEAIQKVVGPDVLLLGTALFAKYPKAARGVNQPTCLTVIGTHQDRQYWGLEPDSAPVASVWIAIDNATKDNGAMQMFPSTHLTALPHVKHYDDCSALFDAQSIVPESLPAESQFLELTAGQYAMFDSRTAHRSGRNISPARRIGLTMIYASADIVLKEMNYEREIEDWRIPMPVLCNGHPCTGTPRSQVWRPRLELLLYNNEDIAGALPQRWVGTIPANIYDAPEMRPMITHHDPHDIPGAQVGTLKKGIEGSRRSVNPLNPRYPMLDGNARPQPLPTFEAQRHPMLRSQRGATSMPNLRGSRSLMPAGKRTFTVPEEFAESVALQGEALASALPEGSQRLPEMQEQRSQGSQGSQRPSARMAQVDMIQPVPPATMAEPGAEDAHNTIRFDLPASEAGGLSRRSASSGALPRA
eukprot:s2993_g5.t2